MNNSITLEIPFTSDIDTAKNYLKKYGHKLEFDIVFHRDIYFICLVCKTKICLQGDHPMLPNNMLVIMNGSIVDDADFYCEKYRTLV